MIDQIDRALCEVGITDLCITVDEGVATVRDGAYAWTCASEALLRAAESMAEDGTAERLRRLDGGHKADRYAELVHRVQPMHQTIQLACDSHREPGGALAPAIEAEMALFGRYCPYCCDGSRRGVGDYLCSVVARSGICIEAVSYRWRTNHNTLDFLASLADALPTTTARGST